MPKAEVEAAFSLSDIMKVMVLPHSFDVSASNFFAIDVQVCGPEATPAFFPLACCTRFSLPPTNATVPDR